MRIPLLVRMAIFGLLALGAARQAAAADICDRLETMYPQPGRAGGGENAFRPLPLFVPARPGVGQPGTLSLSIDVDHVSSAPKGKPGYLYVGNYPVTDIPADKLISGASGPATIVNPETGKSVPIPNACLDGPSWGYGGATWSLIQADTLDVLFQSRLDYSGNTSVPIPTNGSEPCRSSNLHTHGLLISPYHPAKAGLGPYGDYVLDVTQPHHSIDYHQTTDDCGTSLGDMAKHGHGLTDLPLHYSDYIPGEPGVSSIASGQHPSGLFWYHPHVHGYAQFQQRGGTTGVITIGNLTDYACPEGDGSPGNCTITNANIRIMELKELAIQSYGEGLYSMVHDYESDTCTPTGGKRQGECQASDSVIANAKWVFTVNGVEYPVIRPGAGRMEIWRIVNASPSLTYRLSVDPVGGGDSLPFQLLARDGVPVQQTGNDIVKQTQMLLTPATRLEIAIPAPASGGAYILRDNPVSTAGNGNTSGNVWPEIDLAKVIWPKNEQTTQVGANSPQTVLVSGPATPIPHGTGDEAGVPARCQYSVGDTRVIYFVHRFVTVYTGMKQGQGSALHPQTNEVFGLIAGIRHPDGSMDFYPEKGGKPLHSVDEVWKDGVNGTDTSFPGFGHNDYNTVCTVMGNVENWELQNWTGEDHNFHMHQTKFTIDHTGNFYFPPHLSTDVPYTKETDDLIKNLYNHKVSLFADTFPVPRGTSICLTAPDTQGCHGKTTTACSGKPGAPDCPFPGIISLTIDFSRAEQVGTFVYHCHILEHEDGGMMAKINVICPPGNQSCASQQVKEAAICTPSDAATQ
ncbi:MAG TPA: multicopper oxidase domain-containing protein [Acetobacteraceae bacterium]|nr:multicopper oxidase domain-containing protein [Acetobacteraceae bacterium]